MRKWTKQICATLAQECETPREFRKKYNGAYQACLRNGWLQEVGSHFVYPYTKYGHWSVENLMSEAKKYKHRVDFKNLSSGAYQTAKKNKILDLVCFHMVPKGNRNRRYIYEIWNESKTKVYVGLTYNVTVRENSHRRQGKLQKHFGKEFTLTPVTDLLNIDDAKAEEIRRIDDYKRRGIEVLNKQKGGNLGCANEIYTEEVCEKVIRACQSVKEIADKCPSVYHKARRMGWLSRMCDHMDYLNTKPPRGYWQVKENCKMVAEACKTRKELRSRFPTACYTIRINGWDEELCSHLPHLHRDARERQRIAKERIGAATR